MKPPKRSGLFRLYLLMAGFDPQNCMMRIGLVSESCCGPHECHDLESGQVVIRLQPPHRDSAPDIARHQMPDSTQGPARLRLIQSAASRTTRHEHHQAGDNTKE